MNSVVGLIFGALVFALISAYFIFIGFTYPMTVGEVANLQLMHIQSLDMAIGIGAAIIASIFAAGAAIIGSR